MSDVMENLMWAYSVLNLPRSDEKSNEERVRFFEKHNISPDLYILNHSKGLIDALQVKDPDTIILSRKALEGMKQKLDQFDPFLEISARDIAQIKAQGFNLIIDKILNGDFS